MTKTTTIDGITYAIGEISNGMCWFTKIGKRGKPVKQSRPAKLVNGEWVLGDWVAI